VDGIVGGETDWKRRESRTDNGWVNAPITADTPPPPMTPPDLLLRLFDTALYEGFVLASKEPSRIVKVLMTTEYKIDRYCSYCGKTTTWKVVPRPEDLKNVQIEKLTAVNIEPGGSPTRFDWLLDFKLTLVCARRSDHVAQIFVRVTKPPMFEFTDHTTDGTPLPPVEVTKIGQYPSMTDFQLGDLTELEEGMSKAQRREFVRAINCSAHGFNVAACVHYRRVFESVLSEARDEKKKTEALQSWPEFDTMRTGDRIIALRGYVPDFMADHPHLYSILSLGVHELTEEQCGKALPTLRQAIELMMHERVDAARRTKRRAAVSKLLSQTVDEHKR
jgi:hypothetical protein